MKSNNIDFVILCVDVSDPAWQTEKRKYAQIWRDKTNAARCNTCGIEKAVA